MVVASLLNNDIHLTLCILDRVMFYVPLIVIYLYGVYVTVSAYSMLSHGIQVTFLHRARVLFFSQLLLVIYICYWVFLLSLYIGIFISKDESLWHWMMFFIPARGILGVFILFCTKFTKIFSEDHSESGKSTSAAALSFSAIESVDINSALQNEIVAYATVGIKESALLTHKQTFVDTDQQNEYSTGPPQNDFWIKIPEELIQLESFKGIANVVDVEFQHIIDNYAESRSIANLKNLLYQTPDNVQLDEGESDMRSSRASRASSKPTPMDSISSMQAGTGLTLQHLMKDDEEQRLSTTDPLATASSDESLMSRWAHHIQVFLSTCRAHLKRNSILLSSIPSSVHFTEYSPSTFYEIRMLYGIEGIYPQSFEKPIKLHLAEGGASNALFFFSECRKFMAKSCTAEEMTTVRTHAGALRDHFRQNRNSLISRIFGAYKLQVYSSDLYFIVTNNVLLADENESITEKYDLKGSSVHRQMKMPRDGETCRCRLCGNAFVYNSKTHFRSERDLKPPEGKTSILSIDTTGNESRSNELNNSLMEGEVGVTSCASPTSLEKTLSRRMSRRSTNSTIAVKPKSSVPQTVSDFSIV